MKLIPAFRFPLGVGVNAVGKSVWVIVRRLEYLPWATGAGGAGPRNVTIAISIWNLFEVPTVLMPVKVPETLTNLGAFGLGIGLCVHPSGIVPLQGNTAFLFGKLIQWWASMSKDPVS